MGETVSNKAPPLCLCGLRHWSAEREKCKFWEAPPAPVAQPRTRFAKAKGETKSSGTKIQSGTEIRADQNPCKKSRGRPKADGLKPWEAAGLSRRTYYRRLKANAGPPQPKA